MNEQHPKPSAGGKLGTETTRAEGVSPTSHSLPTGDDASGGLLEEWLKVRGAGRQVPGGSLLVCHLGGAYQAHCVIVTNPAGCAILSKSHFTRKDTHNG